MSRARGLGGRGRSTLSPIKHIIVRSLPDPLLNPGTRLRVILTAVCRHLHTPGVLAAPACDKHTRIHHRCRLGVHTHTRTHKFTIEITRETTYTWLRGSDRPSSGLSQHGQPLVAHAKWYQVPQKPTVVAVIRGKFLHSLTAANGWLH